MTNRVGIVGLGRLGLPLAAAFASQGFKIVGVDINPDVLKSIRRCGPSMHEPGLVELLQDRDVQRRISLTDKLEAAVLVADATIVLVATPSEEDGCFSLKYVLPVCSEIGKLLREKDEYHLVIVKSTVNPRDCEDILLPEIIEQSGKKVGPDFGFCYVPEFIALGEILKGYLEPTHVLIGASDMKAASRAHEIYAKLCINQPRIKRMNLVNAELAKIAANCHTILKTAFGNQMAELCERILGANVDEVTEAIGLDSRASPEYLRGTTYAGGPCFPRDLKSLLCIAERAKVKLPLINVTDEINNWQIERLARIVRSHWHHVQAKKLGILGLAYKPNVNAHEPSAGLLLFKKLKHTVPVVAYDPMIVIGQSVRSAQECADLTDVIVITIPCAEFKEVKFHKGQVVIDCWRCLNEDAVKDSGAEYVAIGKGK